MYACLSPTGGYNHFLLGTEDLFSYFQESSVTFKKIEVYFFTAAQIA